MLPPVGTTCLFTFTKAFSLLNGVYKTLSIMTFEAALTNNVNFLTSLYTPAGLNQSDYENDYATYRGQNVVEVQSVLDSSTILYIPEPIIALNPDPTVQKYQQIYYSVMIGAFKDPNVYTHIKTQLDDIVSSVTGVTEGGKWLADPAADEYLTEAEYEALDAARKANVKSIKSLRVQLEEQNAYIVSLQSLVESLKQKIIDQSTTNQ